MAQPRHPDERIWKAFTSGGLSAAEDQRLVRHLLSGCKECEIAAARFWPVSAERKRSLEEDRPIEIDVGSTVDFHRMTEEALVDEAKAERLLDRLSALSLAQQRIVARNHGQYRSWALSWLAVEKAFSLRYDDPGRSRELAEIGVELVQRLSSDQAEAGLVSDLQARAWAVLGNAERNQSDLRASERCFERALSFLEQGTGDPLERGLVLSLLSNLRYDQSRYRESIRLARQSFRSYRSVGDSPGMAAALLQEGASLDLEGEPLQAIEVFSRALNYVEPDSRLHLAAQHNMVAALRRSGRYREAMALLGKIRALYERLGDRINIARMHWLEGEVAVSLDQPARAEVAFREAGEVFIEQRMAFPAALVSLELAALLVAQNRTGEVRELAATVIPIFESLDIHDEAMAALLLFREAVLREAVTTSFVRKIIVFLARAEDDPSLVF